MGAAVSIRPATALDASRLVRLLHEGWSEGAAARLGQFDENRVLEYITRTLKHCFCIVAERSGRIVGSLAIAPAHLPMIAEAVMVEAWFACVPAWRDKGVPGELLAAAERLCDGQGLALAIGTNFTAPTGLDRALAGRSSYAPMRAVLMRLPKPRAKAA
jgi:GNAT superfamily N-acetyltransferase